MKLIYKIVFGNFIIALVFAAIGQYADGGNNTISDFAVVLGIVCLLISIVNLILGFFLFLAKSRIWGPGMLLSGAVLLLLSGICCSSGFGGSFH